MDRNNYYEIISKDGERVGTSKDYRIVYREESNTKRNISDVSNNPFFMLVADYEENLRNKYSLSLADMGRVLMMLAHVIYINQENKMHMKYGNKIVSKNKTLQNMLMMNERQIRNFKQRLKKSNVIHEDSKGLYFTNDIVMKGELGKAQKSKQYIVFSRIIKELYRSIIVKNKSKSAVPFGVLMALIPYIKKKDTGKPIVKGSNNTLMLMKEEEGVLQPMKLSEMAKELKIGPESLEKHMGKLNTIFKDISDQYVFYTVIVNPTGLRESSKEGVVINPKITYSQGINSTAYSALQYAISKSTDGKLDEYILHEE